MDERERPVEVERETTIIQTGDRRGSGGTFAAIIVLLAAAVIAFLYFGGYFERAADEIDVNVNVEAPDIKMPDINIDTQKAEPANKTGG